MKKDFEGRIQRLESQYNEQFAVMNEYFEKEVANLKEQLKVQKSESQLFEIKYVCLEQTLKKLKSDLGSTPLKPTSSYKEEAQSNEQEQLLSNSLEKPLFSAPYRYKQSREQNSNFFHHKDVENMRFKIRNQRSNDDFIEV